MDALKSPLFVAYHNNQPFNDNMLRPCPMLENPELLRAMVESVDHLCDKTTPYADIWKETADNSGKDCLLIEKC